MIHVPSELENTPITIEFLGAPEDLTVGLRAEFSGEDEDVVYSHGFGGLGALLVAAALTPKTIEKLIDLWEKIKTTTPKTSIKIGKQLLTLDGFSRKDAEALLASPALLLAVENVKKR